VKRAHEVQADHSVDHTEEATEAEASVNLAVDRLRLSGVTGKIGRPTRSTVEGSGRPTVRRG